jgi:hypothetical protein
MSIEKDKLIEVQAKIQGSDLRETHKDAITDMLRSAGKATNGVPDKTQALTEAIATLAICFARDALYRREDFRALMDEAMSKHTANCPLVADGSKGVSVRGTWGRVSVPAALGAVALITVWMVVIAATVWKAKGWA